MGFDAARALSDETVWYPEGLQREDGKFIFSNADTVALMRYVWAGCVLPEQRNQYCEQLGIQQGHLPPNIWEQVDSLLKSNIQIKKDNTVFRSQTWPKIVNVSNDIYNFATTAGGTADDSYYANMLNWVREYREELNKPTPNQSRLDSLRDSIAEATKEQVNSISKLLVASRTAREDLQKFEALCHTNRQSVSGHQKALRKTLENQNGLVKALNDKIQEQMKQLKVHLMAYEKACMMAGIGPKYAWINIIGGAVPWVVGAITMGPDALKIKKAIEAIQAAIKQDQEKLRAAVCLAADVTRMGVDVDKLHALITPAIQTLQKLEGAWEKISGNLQGLHDLVKTTGPTIPPFRLKKLQMDNIRNRWNDLAKYVDQYRQNAYISEPSQVTAEDYLKELNRRLSE